MKCFMELSLGLFLLLQIAVSFTFASLDSGYFSLKQHPLALENIYPKDYSNYYPNHNHNHNNKQQHGSDNDEDDDKDDEEDIEEQMIHKKQQDWTRIKYVKQVEPKKVGKGSPSKPSPSKDISANGFNPYASIKGSRRNPPKNKQVKKERKRKNKRDDQMDAFKAGLPAFVIADIDPVYVYSQMAPSKILSDRDRKKIRDEEWDGLERDDGVGEMICKRLGWGFLNGVDIKAESSHWLGDKRQCLFQILMDENVDEVLEWLEEQDIVIGLKGDSPLDAAIGKQ